MSNSQQRPPGWATVFRDTASLVCGWLIIFKQAGILFAAPAEVSEPLLWLAGAMIGVPGVGQILALRFGGGGQPEDGIGGDGAPSEPVVRRRLGSRSSSSNSSGGEPGEE